MQKRNKISVLFLAVLITVFISGCRNTVTSNEYIDLSKGASSEITTETENVDITVYFQDKNGYIVPVGTTIPWTEGIAKAVIRKMMNTPELQRELVVMGLESLIPQEATINGVDITNGLAKIDFNTSKLTFKNIKAEKNFVDGVVLALTSFPTVETVQFMFNGHVIDALPNGTKVSSPLRATDINPATSSTKGDAVSVFYHASSSANYEYFVPVTVYLQNADSFSALEHLIATPYTALETGIPEGTKLLDVKTINDTVCIFFNENFNALKNVTPNEEAAAIRSIALTLSQFEEGKRIKIYAGNKEYIPTNGIDTDAFANIY